MFNRTPARTEPVAPALRHGLTRFLSRRSRHLPGLSRLHAAGIQRTPATGLRRTRSRSMPPPAGGAGPSNKCAAFEELSNSPSSHGYGHHARLPTPTPGVRWCPGRPRGWRQWRTPAWWELCGRRSGVGWEPRARDSQGGAWARAQGRGSSFDQYLPEGFRRLPASVFC